ncbi:MAG: YggU family protein [Desulfobacteraceae bacterium 4572_35.1]|nr:MAG: YggU family protein [Desulfobacteraceae bacterium 4572_35.1]
MDELNQAPWAQTHKDGVVLAILVQPRASKNQLCGVQGEELKLRLTSPPVDGAANKLCGQFLAKLFGCAKSDVTLVSGHKSRHKRLLIAGVSRKQALELIKKNM